MRDERSRHHHAPERRPRRRRDRRRGSAYLAIVGATLLVAVIGFAAVSAARVQLRAGERGGDVQAARSHARSGLQLARLWMERETDWRTRRPNGVWVERRPIDAGSFTIEVVDPADNDLANWETDPVTVTVTGYAGGATQIEQVTLVPRREALSCLNVAAFADGAFQVNSGTLTCDQTVATNANFTTSGSSQIDCRVEAVGLITGSGYLGSRVTDVPRRSTPVPQAVFDAYLANATWINYSSLSSGVMQDVVLSPQSNPYGGATNPLGIYAVDCATRQFGLRNARIVGTLIVINPRNDSRVESAVNVAPAVANFPSLLVRGSMSFTFGSSPLVEGSGRNYNPPGTPYNGQANNTTTDSYPSQLQGLVYVAGNATLNCQGRINGTFVCGGAITGQGTLNLTYRPTDPSNPPPGFAGTAQMVPVPGSAARVVR